MDLYIIYIYIGIPHWLSPIGILNWTHPQPHPVASMPLARYPLSSTCSVGYVSNMAPVARPTRESRVQLAAESLRCGQAACFCCFVSE